MTLHTKETLAKKPPVMINLINKEVNIKEISIPGSQNFFKTDLSLIKNDDTVMKRKDNSEIYDQWLNDSNVENIATSEWTMKVPQIVNDCESDDSSIDSLAKHS